MSIAFKPEETFRDDFTFRNSPEAIRRFPFPFAEDAYMYSVNIEPHTAGPKGTCSEFPIDIDEHYVAECRERAICLEEPGRYLALPHMMPAQWDVLDLEGEFLHNDHWLSAEQKAGGRKIMPCVSRARCTRLLLDR